MIRLIFIVAVIIIGQAYAEVYRWKNDQGVTVYSDTPPVNSGGEEAKPLDLPELNTASPSNKPTIETQKAAPIEVKSASPYQELKIIQPENGSPVRANGGQVAVSLLLSPELIAPAGHLIQLYIDDSPIASGPDTRFTLQNVSRGVHVVYAQVVDKNHKVLITSDNITFDVLRHSALFNNSNN